jgi:glycosyltransferase involved in cell wall biosynthesis
VITVVYGTDYDMARARAGWRLGKYPSHHLYGTAYFPVGFRVIDVASTGTASAALTATTRGQLGDIGLQKEFWRVRKGASIFYSAQGSATRLLALARRLNVQGVPMVGVVHGVPRKLRTVHRRWLSAYDALISLSAVEAGRLEDLGIPHERIHVLRWGPDLEFRPFLEMPPPSGDGPVVSTGKTGRDVETIIAAAKLIGVKARIYARDAGCLRKSEVPPSIELREATTAAGRSGPLNYDHVLSDLRDAAVVAIPLMDPKPVHGLTELNDALACGKPVVMTRTPYVDIDIEGIGCGVWVRQGDVAGWAETLRELTGDEARMRTMGIRGRQFAQQYWNARGFGEGVERVISKVLDGPALN